MRSAGASKPGVSSPAIAKKVPNRLAKIQNSHYFQGDSVRPEYDWIFHQTIFEAIIGREKGFDNVAQIGQSHGWMGRHESRAQAVPVQHGG